LIEILSKLKRIPVTVSSLQETGLGKLINRYGKQKGVVGDKATAVVAVWKTAVEKEVERARMPSPAPPQESPSSAVNNSDAESDATSWDSYEKGFVKREDPVDSRRDGIRKDLKSQKARISDKVASASREVPANQKAQEVLSKTNKYNSETKENHRHKTDKKSLGLDHSRQQSSNEGGKSKQNDSHDESKSKHSSSGEVRKSKHSSSGEASKSRHSSSGEGSKSRHSSSREGSKSRHSSSGEGSKSRHSSSREGSKSRHSSSREGSKSRHKSSSKDSSQTKSSHSSSHKSLIQKELGDENHVLDTYKSSSKSQTRVSDDEELTDSDEAFGEESASTSAIEEYYKKMLQQSTNTTEGQSLEKNRKPSRDKHLESSGKDRTKSHQKEKHRLSSGESSSRLSRVHRGSSSSNHSSSSKDKEHRKDSSHGKEKTHSGLPFSSGSHHSKSHSTSRPEKTKASSSDHIKTKMQSWERERTTSESNVSVKREEHKRVERKRKQHSMSDSEEESESIPEKQSKTDSVDANKHSGSKHSKSTSSHSKSSSKYPSSYDSVNVKKEKVEQDSKYGRKSSVTTPISIGKGHQHSQHILQAELLSEMEEDLYSPTHISVKKEKSWSPSPPPNGAHYSPTPISTIGRNKQDGSDVDSLSVRSYSPSVASARSIHSNIEDEGALRYSPPKIFASVKKENPPSSSSSRETTPSYNPTPIKKERSVSPSHLQVRSRYHQNYQTDKTSRAHTSRRDSSCSPTFEARVKLDPSGSHSEAPSEEESVSRPATKKKERNSRASYTTRSRETSPNSDSSHSQKFLKRRQRSSSASDSQGSDGEDFRGSSLMHQQKGKERQASSSPCRSSDDASEGYIPTVATGEIDHGELSDSDMSVGANHHKSSPLLDRHSERNSFPSPKSSKRREIKSERLSPALLSSHEEDEEDIYLPVPLSNKIKEEPYSPTPKSSSAKNSYRDPGDVPLKPKSFMASSSHTEKNKSSKSASHHYNSSSSSNEKKISKHSSSSHSHSNSKKRSDSSSKSSHSSSSSKHKSLTPEAKKAKLSQERELSPNGSGSPVNSTSNKSASSKSHEKPRFLSSSARNSPASHSDISHTSSSSYPDHKRKHQVSKTSHKPSSSPRSHSSGSVPGNKDRDSQQTSSGDKSIPDSSIKSSKLPMSSDKYKERSSSQSKSSSSYKSHSKSSSQHHTKTGAHKSRDDSVSVKTEPYSSSGQKTSSSSSSSSLKKMKSSKRKAEEPELDLFSDTLDLKITASSSPVPKKRPVKTVPSKSLLASQNESPRSSVSPTPVPVQPRHSSKHSTRDRSPHKVSRADDYERTHKANNLFHSDSDEEAEDVYIPGPSSKKNLVQLDEKKEAQMSFDDFMNLDSAALLNKSKSLSKTANSSGSRKTSSQSHTSSKSKYSSSQKAISQSGEDFYIPTPSKNVKVTELDILSLLPETQALYRPLPARRAGLNGEDEEDQGTSQGNLEDIGLRKLARTQVYCGKRQGVTEVKPLFDLCMQLLIENIDALDCVGGVPYDLLKPVLERCTAQQLYHLEDYNPHFLDDSDELWERLCLRDFRGSKPEEMELWREMYLRKHNEREIKYQKLKESMSSTIVKGQTGRKAQLAYMDTPVKAPRDVLRRQMKFGTGCVKMNKGRGAGVKPYKPSAMVPVY
ncbi:hypothetical protein EGW08_000618, partial [Elysia chlorotica]